MAIKKQAGSGSRGRKQAEGKSASKAGKNKVFRIVQAPVPDVRAWTVYTRYFSHGEELSPVFDLRTELGIAAVVDKGVPTDAVFDAIDSGVLDANTVYDVVLPRRTLTHRKTKNQPLSRDESDRFARVLRIHARAEEALGSRERATRWLHKENRALNGRVPIELLSSDAGARAVEKVIGRIEHGVFS